MTPVEVEQDGHHSKPGPPDILESGFEIVKDEAVEPGGRSVGLDRQAGAAIAEHEPAQDLDAARTQEVKPLVERAVTATAGEAALRRPRVGAEVPTVAQPRQVGANDEADAIRHARMRVNCRYRNSSTSAPMIDMKNPPYCPGP